MSTIAGTNALTIINDGPTVSPIARDQIGAFMHSLAKDGQVVHPPVDALIVTATHQADASPADLLIAHDAYARHSANAELTPIILNNPRLLECFDLVKYGDNQELFLRAAAAGMKETSVASKHDAVHMIKLTQASLVGVAKRIADKATYEDAFQSKHPSDYKALCDYFARVDRVVLTDKKELDTLEKNATFRLQLPPIVDGAVAGFKTSSEYKGLREKTNALSRSCKRKNEYSELEQRMENARPYMAIFDNLITDDRGDLVFAIKGEYESDSIACRDVDGAVRITIRRRKFA